VNQTILRALPVMLGCFSAYAQQGTGTISGTVTDPQGAVVAGARVEVARVDTGSVFRALTNERGLYVAPGLAVGPYEVRAEREGFKRGVRSGIVLQVDQNAQVDFTLQVGQVVETVEVIGEAPLVDSSSATLGQVIENRRVQELPLNGRSALALTLLTAGVISNAGPLNSGFGDRGIQLSSVSINGSPNSMNAQMLDGNNNVLSYVGEVGIPPAVDAVEEFKVQSGSMSAEYGFTAGGSINLVTKSGTNDLHGTAYEFLRNEKFDARNTFATRKLPLRYNQFGASLGGAVIRNRLFGFFNWEQYLLRRTEPRIATVPIPAWREGDFRTLATNTGQFIPIYDPATTRANPSGSGLIRDPFPNNIVPRGRFDRITPTILAFWPLPNRPPINAFTHSQNFQDDAKTRVDWTQSNFKIDYHVSERNHMFFRYTTAEHDAGGNSIFTDQTVGQDRNDNQLNRNAVISDTHTFSPTLVNNLRVGIMRQIFVFRAANGGQDWPGKLGLPAVVPNDQFPQINFGFGIIGGQAYGTRGSLNWDTQNMVTKITGGHTFKIGANYRILYGGNQQGTALSGDFGFGGLTSNPQQPAGSGSSLAQFLTGEVSSAFIDRILGNSWHGYALSFFFQDDWKISRRLTLNLGMRWDFQQKPYERHNGQINFDPTAREPVTGLPGAIVFAGVNGQPRSFMEEDHNDFGPRFGFAYDVFGTGKTIFRGGYGIYYPSIFWRNFLGSTTLFSTTRTNYVARGPGLSAFRFAEGFPYAPIEPTGASAGPSALLGQSVGFREPDGTTPITQQWNASIQQQIANWLIDVTYAANKGNHFAGAGYSLNQLHPDLRLQLGLSLSDPVPNPLAGRIPGGLGAATVSRERSMLLYPHYNAVNVDNPRLGNYLSHQLQINLKRQYANGLLMLFAYTTGKKTSDSQQIPVNFGGPQGTFTIEGANEIGFQDALYNRQVNKSLDPADVSQRAVVSLVYELPFGTRGWSPTNAVARKLVSGWQVNTIGVMQSGIPLIVRGANNFQANRPNSTGQSARIENPTRERWFDTTAFVNPPPFTFGNVGRVLPDVRTPGTLNFDLSLIKGTRISERVNVQFRAEAFNFLNNVNLGAPATSFAAGPDGRNSSATFGTISSARDARVMQLGLKVIF
jgi:hypothetical protein